MNEHPLFRLLDPPTSKAAGKAAKEFARGHERKILDALAAGPGTKDEIASRCGLTEQQVIRRRAALLRDGLVVLTGDKRQTATGNAAEVWRLA
jgi:predicted ArsR family transcriptional regulator